MARTKDEIQALIQSIGTCEDEVQRREDLASLSEEFTSLYDTNETLTTTNQQLTADKESLRQANMKLFLRVGEEKTEEEIETNIYGNKPEKEKLKFDDLFDEKGGLK